MDTVHVASLRSGEIISTNISSWGWMSRLLQRPPLNLEPPLADHVAIAMGELIKLNRRPSVQKDASGAVIVSYLDAAGKWAQRIFVEAIEPDGAGPGAITVTHAQLPKSPVPGTSTTSR